MLSLLEQRISRGLVLVLTVCNEGNLQLIYCDTYFVLYSICCRPCGQASARVFASSDFPKLAVPTATYDERDSRDLVFPSEEP